MRYSIFISISLFVFLCTTKVFAQNNDYILLIDSYSSNYAWSKTIERSFRSELKKHDSFLSLHTEYLNADLFPDQEKWEDRMQLIIDQYSGNPPKIVVLLADIAWMAYRKEYRPQWENVNVLLVGVKHYSLDADKYTHKKALEVDDFRPTEELCKQYNATGILEEIYAGETIRMIQRLQPDLKEIAFISDKQFYGIYAYLSVEKYMEEHHPDIAFTFLDGRFISTNTLYQKLQKLSPSTSVLLSCWIQDVEDYTYDREKTHRNISTLSQCPVYILNDWGKTDSSYMGGYYSHTSDYGRQLITFTEKIFAGEEARHIPLQTNRQGLAYHINETLLQKYSLSAQALPQEEVLYYNLLPGFWEKHGSLILLCCIIFFSATVIYLIIFTSLRFVFYRKKLNWSQVEIDTSLNNQQHLSDALHFFLDSSNEQEAVNKILQRLLTELNADRAYIFEFDEIRQTNSNTYEICSSHATPQLDILQDIPNQTVPWLYKRMQEDKMLLIEDLKEPQEGLEGTEWLILLNQDILSLMIAPLHVNNKLWGYVGVDYTREKKHYKKQDVIYLTTLARILCIGIEHFRSEKRNTISQQRMAELESLFSFASAQANVGVAQWNPFTGEGFATDQWFYNLGETTRDISEVIGVYSHMHPEDRQELNRFVAAAGAGEADSFEKNIRIGRNGKWHWYRYHATLKNHDPQHRQAELVFLSIDIDNLKKIENNLIVAKAKAEESDKLKSAFIANMSHEIRTPLNAIVGFSNLIAETPDLCPEEKEEYCRIIATNNQLLLQLIDDILNISKIESGILEFTEDVIKLNHFLSEIEAMYLLRAKPDVEIKFIRDSSEEYTVYTDHIRLNQVISNFLNNALKFTSKGHIYFGYRIQEKDIYFYVEDTGIGIAPENQKTIFQRFVKLNSFVQGTGLGLSICSTIVEKLQGKIGVISEPGKGSTFWFTIPRQDI